MIIFAVLWGGGMSVSKLFLAGASAGILMCFCLAVAAYVLSVKHTYPAEPFPGWGAFGALYALLLTRSYDRWLPWNSFVAAVTGAVRTTSMVMILIAFASSFAYLRALYHVPARLSDLLVSISDNPIIILLVLDMIMDMAALILIRCACRFLVAAVHSGLKSAINTPEKKVKHHAHTKARRGAHSRSHVISKAWRRRHHRWRFKGKLDVAGGIPGQTLPTLQKVPQCPERHARSVGKCGL